MTLLFSDLGRYLSVINSAGSSICTSSLYSNESLVFSRFNRGFSVKAKPRWNGWLANLPVWNGYSGLFLYLLRDVRSPTTTDERWTNTDYRQTFWRQSTALWLPRRRWDRRVSSKHFSVLTGTHFLLNSFQTVSPDNLQCLMTLQPLVMNCSLAEAISIHFRPAGHCSDNHHDIKLWCLAPSQVRLVAWLRIWLRSLSAIFTDAKPGFLMRISANIIQVLFHFV